MAKIEAQAGWNPGGWISWNGRRERMATAAPIPRKTPAHILERVRKYRTDNRDLVNARHRKNSAKKRAAGLEQSAAEVLKTLGREPQTLEEWFPTQAKFSEWAQLAREVGVSRRTMLDWRTGKHPAVRGHRQKLYQNTGLSCFADAVNWKPRERPARKVGEESSVPLLAELVVRCGLATRELRQLRLSQIEDKGIRLANGRLVLFGGSWEQVSRSSLDAWLSRARPTDLLFFSRKPVDRNRPVSGVWISRVLRASGVSLQERRSARLRHFAGDFARLGSGARFLSHMRNVHALSKTGSHEALDALQKRKALLAAGDRTMNSGQPEEAFNVLFPPKNKGGRPPAKQQIFLEAEKLHAAGKSWNEITRSLLPEEFKSNQSAARERIRKGVKYHKKAR